MNLKEIISNIFLASKNKQASNIKLAEYTLEDGRVVSIDENTMIAAVIKEGEPPKPLEPNTYTTKEGATIVVEEEGKVKEITEKAAQKEETKQEQATMSDASLQMLSAINAQLSEIIEGNKELKEQNIQLKEQQEQLLSRVDALEQKPAGSVISTEKTTHEQMSENAQETIGARLLKNIKQVKKDYPSKVRQYSKEYPEMKAKEGKES